MIQFPDYVQRMCQEDEDNNCMLAYEFKVGVHHHNSKKAHPLSPCRIYKMHPHSLIMWLVSLTTQNITDSRMYIHVRMIDH